MKKRNVKDVVTIIKYRLKDALLKEKKARKIYLQDRENLWKTIQPKTSQQILLMKKYNSLKKETAEKEFEQGKKKLMKKITWLKSLIRKEHEERIQISEEAKALEILDNDIYTYSKFVS